MTTADETLAAIKESRIRREFELWWRQTEQNLATSTWDRIYKEDALEIFKDIYKYCEERDDDSGTGTKDLVG